MSHSKYRHRLQPLALLLSFTGCALLALPLLAVEPEAAPKVEVVGEIASAETSTAGAAPDLIGPVIPLASSEMATGPAEIAAPPSPTLVAASTAPIEPTTPSQNVTINLINRLVDRGVLTKEDATDLIHQAEEDAAKAKAHAASQQLAAAANTAPTGAAPSDGAVHVAYVPEVVKAQMREDIKQDVLKQARNENWAAPRTFPDWVSRFHFNGDVRVRYEGDFMPSGNDAGPGGEFWNFNGINQGSPYDTTDLVNNPPLYNTDQDRNRARLRARFGVDVDISEGFTSGFRIASGDSSSPVSQNQSLGGATNGAGGNFSKYAIWLDRGFIKYQVGSPTDNNVSVTVGRFDNPFFGTSMIWADDLGFDGLAVKGKYKVADGITPFMTIGAFPVYNTDLNFSTNQVNKFSSQDKWLCAIQGGSDFKINKDWNLKVAAAFYDFQNVEGKVSNRFVPLNASDAGNTDNTRPSFAQKGNTYIALRDIIPDASNGQGTTNQWQYFGLATPYKDVALTGQLDFSGFDPFHIWFVGEYVKNVAFDRNDIESNGPSNASGPVNNNGPNDGAFAGGDSGYIATVNLGKPALEKFGDWNLSLGYRYVESDSVIDGFCDSDFGGGGTNLKGFTLGGKLGLAKRVSMGLRWLSATTIAGPTFKEDIVQLDLNAKF